MSWSTYDKIQDSLLRERKEMAKALYLGKRVQYAMSNRYSREALRVKGYSGRNRSVGTATVEDVRIRDRQVTYFMSDGEKIPRDWILEWWEIAEESQESVAA